MVSECAEKIEAIAAKIAVPEVCCFPLLILQEINAL